jgi:hypothetical protein
VKISLVDEQTEDIAHVLDQKGRDSFCIGRNVRQSLKYHEKAIRLLLFGEYHPLVAESY